MNSPDPSATDALGAAAWPGVNFSGRIDELLVYAGVVDHGLVGASEPVPILLMADYSADPLWRRCESGKASRVISLDLDLLPLTPHLKQQLRAWAARFDALSKAGYEWPNVAEERQWITDGRALLEPVRNELGPGYDVTYFADQSRW